MPVPDFTNWPSDAVRWSLDPRDVPHGFFSSMLVVPHVVHDSRGARTLGQALGYQVPRSAQDPRTGARIPPQDRR